MKAGTTQLLKFKKLKRRLGLPEWQAIGLLEAVWKCTRENAPDGDIGKLSNEDIAAAIEWDGCPDEMIGALTEYGWLDPDPVYRLVVHDWSDHVPTYMKGNYKQHGKRFANDIAKDRANGVAKEAAKKVAKDAPKDTPTKSNQVKPSQAQPSQVNPSPVAPVPGEVGEGERPKDQAPDPFLDFWSVVHRKEARGVAAKAFAKATAEVAKREGKTKREAAAWITRRMAQFAKSPQARDDVKGKIHPATWLNQQRFDDDDSVWGLRARGGYDGRPPDLRDEIERRTRALRERQRRAAAV